MRIVIYIFTFLLIFSCSKKEKRIDVDSKKAQTVLSDSVIDSSEIKAKIITLEKPYRFQNYEVQLFDGKLAEPDFKGNEFANDPEYVEFIKSGCKRNGINFGGHFTIIEMSCGALCSNIFIVDRIDGRIFTDIKPNDGSYGYKYRIDSKLLIANSEVFTNDSYTEYTDAFDRKPEFYVWEKDNFSRLNL